MIAVQTLNLYTNHNSNNTSALKLLITMSLVSSYLLRKHYEKVILYADERTAKILSDSYYTEIRILPTDTLVKYGYGTLAKLYTYGNVEEEYIHFDIDYFLFNKIELENKILCSYLETKEKCGELAFETAYSSLINKLKLDYDKFGFNIVNKNYAINMCIFGVPKIYHKQITEYFKKLDKYTQQNIESIVNTDIIPTSPQLAIEQYIPVQWFLENEFKIKELNEFDNHHIKGQAGYIRIYNAKDNKNITNFKIKNIDIKKHLLKYMQENIGHHLGDSKDLSGIMDMLIYVINEMYPEVFIKLNKLLPNILSELLISNEKSKKLI
jgi:hypothetical protein